MPTARSLALALAPALFACALNQPAVPVDATDGDLRRMAGRWEGSYRSDETGRSGGILFTLAADGDSAHGDVVMDPTGSYAVRNTADPGARSGEPELVPARVLTIRFVQVRGSEVAGTMDPYVAPGCNCTVRTTFTGHAEADAISGTYVTLGEGMRPARGVWEVRRTR